MAENKKVIQEITSVFKKRYSIEKSIEKIKRSIEEEKNIKAISLFILEVGILENWIKWFNVKNLKTEKYDEYFDTVTLGTAIRDFESYGKFQDVRDYRIRRLLTREYKQSFVLACRKVNNLRNDLYHNLYLKAISLEFLLKKIKQRLEFDKIIYGIEYENLGNYKSLVYNERLPSNWTIEMLIHILVRYYLRYKS
jgi:hypothetical protein